MAVITDYASLQTAVADYLVRSDLTTFVPNFIQNCENKLYRTLNLRNEETALSVAISNGVAAVPDDFKALKFAYIDGSPIHVVKWVSIEKLYQDYPIRGQAGTPAVVSREAGNFVFGPVPGSGTLKGIYYAKQDPLRTTDGSWYVTDAPDVLLYGSLLEATPFIKDDPRIPVWQQFYADGVRSLEIEEQNAEASQGALVPRPQAYV